MSTQHSIGYPFIELQTVDSTNNYAMGMVHAGMAQHGTAVFAHEQSKGRGQRGKTWVSEAGNNIALSVFIEPKLASSELFLLSMAVATGTLTFLNRYTANEVSIKWPNDIYWRDRKAGGILIENVLQGNEWKWAIAGVGLNINQTRFDGLENKAVSLRQITSKVEKPIELAHELCNALDEQLAVLYTNKSLVVEAYQQHLYKRGEWVRLKKGSRVFEAKIIGVTAAGELRAQHATEERFEVGEVEWVM